MYCTYCLKYSYHQVVYSKGGSIDIKFSNLKAYCAADCCSLVMEVVLVKEKEILKTTTKKVVKFRHGKRLTLFTSPYFTAKKNLPFATFSRYDKYSSKL